jgi:hypothetical protein
MSLMSADFLKFNLRQNVLASPLDDLWVIIEKLYRAGLRIAPYLTSTKSPPLLETGSSHFFTDY